MEATPECLIPAPNSGTVPVFAHLRAGQEAWAARPLAERLGILGRLRRRLAGERWSLARSIPATGGRSAADSLAAEVLPLLDAIAFLERSAPRLLRERGLGARGRPFWLSGHGALERREPHGLVLVLAPFNFPLFLPGAQALQALAAGNAVAVKPAPGYGAPLRLLARHFAEVGGPADVLEILDESRDAGVEAVAAAPDLVVLTGSAETGRAVMAACAEYPVPLIVELSGCDAMHLLTGADVEMAASALAYGLRLNGSAVCIAPRRAVLPRALLAEFRRAAQERLAEIPALPVEARSQVRAVGMLREAAAAGTEIWPEVPSEGAGALRPTLVVDPPADSPLLGTDVFAPIASLVVLEREEQRLEREAECAYALGASIFGPKNEARALAGELDLGFVSINDLIVPSADPRLAFGGRHQSGFGVTRGAQGLLAMTRLKTVTERDGSFRPHFDPIEEGQERLVDAYTCFAHEARGLARLAALGRFISAIGRLARRNRRSAGE